MIWLQILLGPITFSSMNIIFPYMCKKGSSYLAFMTELLKVLACLDISLALKQISRLFLWDLEGQWWSPEIWIPSLVKFWKLWKNSCCLVLKSFSLLFFDRGLVECLFIVYRSMMDNCMCTHTRKHHSAQLPEGSLVPMCKDNNDGF